MILFHLPRGRGLRSNAPTVDCHLCKVPLLDLEVLPLAVHEFPDQLQIVVAVLVIGDVQECELIQF